MICDATTELTPERKLNSSDLSRLAAAILCRAGGAEAGGHGAQVNPTQREPSPHTPGDNKRQSLRLKAGQQALAGLTLGSRPVLASDNPEVRTPTQPAGREVELLGKTLPLQPWARHCMEISDRPTTLPITHDPNLSDKVMYLQMAFKQRRSSRTPHPTHRGNNPSADHFSELIRSTFLEEVPMGMVDGPLTKVEAAARCGCDMEDLCPGPLAGIDEGGKIRTIYDGSVGGANDTIRNQTVERTTAPTVLDGVQALHWLHAAAEEGPPSQGAPGPERLAMAGAGQG